MTAKWGSGCVWAALWKRQRAAGCLAVGKEPPTEGKARKLVSKKKPTSQHSIAKNTKRQSTEAIQRAMSYDKEVLNVTNNQKNAMISYTVDGNTNLKSLLGELFDSIYQNRKWAMFLNVCTKIVCDRKMETYSSVGNKINKATSILFLKSYAAFKIMRWIWMYWQRTISKTYS